MWIAEKEADGTCFSKKCSLDERHLRRCWRIDPRVSKEHSTVFFSLVAVRKTTRNDNNDNYLLSEKKKTKAKKLLDIQMDNRVLCHAVIVAAYQQVLCLFDYCSTNTSWRAFILQVPEHKRKRVLTCSLTDYISTILTRLNKLGPHAKFVSY